MSSSFALSSLLEKTENRDKDFRYMATSDLFAELSKDSFKPDSDGERTEFRRGACRPGPPSG